MPSCIMYYDFYRRNYENCLSYPWLEERDLNDFKVPCPMKDIRPGENVSLWSCSLLQKRRLSGLTQLRRLTHICVSKLGHYWFRSWTGVCASPCLYLDQCWCSVNWIVGNKLWSIWSQTMRKFIPEYEYEIRACENCENLYPAIICL